MDTLHPRLGKYILLEGLKTWQVFFIGRPEITWKVDTSSTNCGPYKTKPFRATPRPVFMDPDHSEQLHNSQELSGVLRFRCVVANQEKVVFMNVKKRTR